MRCMVCTRQRSGKTMIRVAVCGYCYGRAIATGWKARRKGKDPEPLRRQRKNFKRRTRVARNGCWIWLGTRGQNGYGMVSDRGRSLGAHRLAYQLWKGLIPRGLVVHHRCERPSCVNPAHLEAVTHLENIAASAPKSYRAILLHHHGSK